MKIGKESILGVNVYEWVKNNTDLEKSFFHFAQEGKRGYQNVDLLHKMGFKAGISDIFMSKPNIEYSGLWIELKDDDKKPTLPQKLFIEQMIKDGYYACYCDNFEDTIAIIKWFYQIVSN